MSRCLRQGTVLFTVAVLVWIFGTCAGCGGTTLNAVSGTTTAQATQVFSLTNEERSKEGLAPLTWNEKLADAAASHAEDMIARSYFSHYSPEGEDVGDRATAAGYEWLWIGENIAAGQTTAAEALEDWMNSPGHRENILREQFTEIGVAYRTTILGRAYYVQVFGAPMPGS